MRRIAAAVLVLLTLLPIPVCAAEEAFYGEYVPRSEHSALFYIDVYSKQAVTAAVFEVQFDDSMVGYHASVAESGSASVRDNLQDGRVIVAFADSKAVDGKLCRLSFKALKEGSVSFVLHMRQAADGEKNLLTQWSDHTVTVKLGKEDAAVGSASVRSGGSGTSSRSSLSSSRGGKGDSADDDAADDASEDEVSYAFSDLRRDGGELKWMLIGAAVPVLCGALVWLGFLIGRKSKGSATKPDKEEKPGEAIPEPDDIIEEDES